jgi:hypothetical protein
LLRLRSVLAEDADHYNVHRRTAPWGSHHRSGPPNHLSSCRLEASRDEIDSVS